MIVLDQGFPDALYGSTKSLATVGPNTRSPKGPGWFKLAIVATMLLTLLSAACFTGGLIDRLTSRRLTGLVGLNAVPRRDHVVVVGLGQVGYRLCTAAARVRHPGRGRRDRRGGRDRRPRPPATSCRS